MSVISRSMRSSALSFDNASVLSAAVITPAAEVEEHLGE
jgi:hypothetical protein